MLGILDVMFIHSAVSVLNRRISPYIVLLPTCSGVYEYDMVVTLPFPGIFIVLSVYGPLFVSAFMAIVQHFTLAVPPLFFM